mmetsp:Transcript_28463/g.42263  ORF Transcript_28463/g.42263 Transcript_28463/m.42263 type:complete len:595 (-) Transcript_28463:185-1969(-)
MKVTMSFVMFCSTMYLFLSGLLVVKASSSTVAFVPLALLKQQQQQQQQQLVSFQSIHNIKTCMQMSNNHKNKSKKKKSKRRNIPPPVVAPPPEEETEGEEGEPIRTLGGGPNLIFAMARRMLVWDDESYIGLNDSSTTSSPITSPPPPTTTASTTPLPQPPRWHPTTGISDNNPQFRSQSPVMNNLGYAGVIRRNSRKRNKPSMWRYALRMYDKMKALEQQQALAAAELQKAPRNNMTDDARTATGKQQLMIKRSTVHHEGALVACMKLGLYKKSLDIYQDVWDYERQLQLAQFNSTSTTRIKKRIWSGTNKNVGVTDNMILSIVKACVRASRQGGNGDSRMQHYVSQEEQMDVEEDEEEWRKERRVPLDVAKELLLNLEERHNIPLVARHINPLAAAYQSLGYITEASTLIQTALVDRTTLYNFTIPSSSSSPKASLLKKKNNPYNEVMKYDDDYLYDDDDDDEDDLEEFSSRVNIYDPTNAKDRASYSLYIKNAILEENWAQAVCGLKNMTEYGGYRPNGRNLNSWCEASSERRRYQNEEESGEVFVGGGNNNDGAYGVEGSGRGGREGGQGGSRRRKNWKKRRDEYWMNGF